MIKLGKIKVEDALGKELLHDITGSDKSDYRKKATIYKRGHVITNEDIDWLKMNGKSHINVLESDISLYYHEDEAAILMGEKARGSNVSISEINEGKINFVSECTGFSKIDKEQLFNINMNSGISFGTLKSHRLVKKGDIIASFRIVDLFYEKNEFDKILSSITSPIVNVESIIDQKIALLSVGDEIYHGLKKDLSYEKLSSKLENYNQTIAYRDICADDYEKLVLKIRQCLNDYDIILVVGGMSVDADDISASAIESCITKKVSYGSPVIPGSMIFIGYNYEKIILGLPANVVFSKETVFDKLIPSVLTKEKVTKEFIVNLGYGGIE